MRIDFPAIDVKVQGLETLKIPRMVKIRQKYDNYSIEDVPAYVRDVLKKRVDDKASFSGKRIAITAGSRGIPYYSAIMKTLVDTLQSWGAKPFIVPAMGSHAGATAEGQREMLAGFGITEEAVGCPVISSMETIAVGTLEDGTVIHCDKNAFESDGIVVFNKVKPHTRFKGEHESGLLKMMVIGLGKHNGAASMHALGYEKFPERLLNGGKLFVEKAPVILGVGLVQNAQDDISDVEIFRPEEIVDGDAAMLRIAKNKMARILFPSTDIIIIDRIGKDISGSGFDPNVIARKDLSFPGALENQIIFVRGLTEGTHHNATGLHSADITTLRCVRDVDWGITWTNIMTAVPVSSCRIPCFAPSDREAILWSIKSCAEGSRENVRIVRIRDTINMEYIEVSENLAEELRERNDLEIIGEPKELLFDPDGYIVEETMP